MNTLLVPFEQLTGEINESTVSAADVIPSVMVLNCLLNKLPTARGVKTYKSTQGCEQVIRWLSLITVHYFDADIKQVSREMLQTQLDKMETDTVTVRTEEERPWTDRAETSLLDV